MNLPILAKLKEGEKFDFYTLADNTEQTDEYWKWWWDQYEQNHPITIARPEVIEDGDTILSETINKATVNLCSFRTFFDKTLFNLTEKRVLSATDGMTRDSFRELIKGVAKQGAIKLPGRPQIIFLGGGYGSGKTTAINNMARSGILPVQMSHHVGVDIFKSLIPEYALIKAVADGRASLTVQKECYMLANELFTYLVGMGYSFVWDSSMSAKNETLERIESAKEQGYELMMVAVLTPLQVAIKQAMHRARKSGRFPNPVALPHSHIGFREAFNDYVEHFDEIVVFANQGKNEDSEIVARKQSGTKELALLNSELFNSLLVPPAQEVQ